MIEILLNKIKSNRSYLYVFISNLFSVFLNFIIISFITKDLGVKIYGQYIFILSLVNSFVSFFSYRGGETVVYFMTKRYNSGSIFRFSFFCDFMLGLIFLAVSSILVVYYNGEINKILFFYQIFISLNILLRSTPIGLIKYKKCFFILSLVSLLELITKLCAIVLLNVSTITELYHVFLSCTIIYTICYFIIFFIFLKQMLFFLKKITFSVFLSYSIKNYFSTSIKSLTRNLDSVLIGLFISFDSLGIYTVLKKIFTPIPMIVQSYTSVAFPSFVSLYQEKKISSIKRFTKDKTIEILVLSFIVFIGILLFVPFVERFFNITLENNEYLLLGLLFFKNIVSVTFWWSPILSNSVNPVFSLYANLLYLLCVPFFIIPLSYFGGVHGIIIGYILMEVVMYCYWRKKYIQSINV